MLSNRVFKANILVIDDSETIRKKIKTILEAAGLLDCWFEAGSGLEGFRVLMDKKVDLVVCDMVMPEFDGLKFLISKATRSELHDIPVIILTTEGEVSSKIRALEHGASDYLLKPFDEGELIARVKVQLKIKSLQDELNRKNAELNELAGTDDLTRVYNRRAFLQACSNELSHSKRYKQALSLAIFDLDHFKRINDQYGHLTGDSVLVRTAELIRGAIRACDVIGRYGGDELVLLLPHTDLASGVSFAERIRKRIESTNFMEGETQIPLTISGGLSSYPESECASVEELLRKADQALYRAKSKGRNCTESA
ncbi:MAG TPA: diguanylate cyclase [Acidobacteriota bacterium]|nr:diguanylate cyclase [Acidobacteriota bacterium]